MIKNLKKKKGFTLIELIIVIAILAILAAIALPSLGKITGKANESAAKANEKILKNVASILYAEEGDAAANTYAIDGTADSPLELLLDDDAFEALNGYSVVITADGNVTVTAP